MQLHFQIGQQLEFQPSLSSCSLSLVIQKFFTQIKSAILTQTLKVPSSPKPCKHLVSPSPVLLLTIPQGDGMVERFNRSLLQLLRAYVDNQDDWEWYLPLVLYAYRTAVHSSTGSSPFLLMFGCHPTLTPFLPSTAFDSTSYPAHICAKLAELQDLAESNLAAAAHHQKSAYDRHSLPTVYSVGDIVWLSTGPPEAICGWSGPA